MSVIYKILDGEAWTQACRQGRFEGAAIDLRDGFIHLSTGSQAPETARLHFRGQADLLLVAFESAGFGAALKWEPSRGGALFPHLYGTIDPALALWVRKAPLDEAGIPQLGILP
jgi:uncharacterized protein (DUF952 family)